MLDVSIVSEMWRRRLYNIRTVRTTPRNKTSIRGIFGDCRTEVPPPFSTSAELCVATTDAKVLVAPPFPGLTVAEVDGCCTAFIDDVGTVDVVDPAVCCIALVADSVAVVLG
jgi:hypothetical protein